MAGSFVLGVSYNRHASYERRWDALLHYECARIAGRVHLLERRQKVIGTRG